MSHGLKSPDPKSRRLLALGALALGLITPSLVAGAALAADLDAPYLGSQQFPEDNVEFGSGWYIRGDIGVTRLPSVATGNPGMLNNAQAYSQFNNGGNPQLTNEQASGASAFGVTQGHQLGYTASLGGGYQMNRWFRADVVADFNEPVTGRSSQGGVFCQTGVSTVAAQQVNGLDAPLTGDCTGSYYAKLSSYDVLVNGYIDLGTWYRITPYVGAGLGMAFGHYQISSTYVQANNAPYQVTYTDQSGNATSPNFDRRSSGNYYNFAFALMGGISIDVYDHTKLDIGYRYLNLGRIAGVSGSLSSQQVRAGIRYMIDD